MMSNTRLLQILLPILMIDSLLEVGFIGSTVGFLHKDGIYTLAGPSGTRLHLLAKPKHMMADEGHTSNGAAGTALISVGLLGLLLISGRGWLGRRFPRFVNPLHYLWLVLTILSFLLTLAALIYTMVVVHQTSGQTIDWRSLFPDIHDSTPRRYATSQKWTSQTWYGAVLSQLPLVAPTDISNIRSHYRLMRGWQWNLVPLFMIQTVVTVLVVREVLAFRKGAVVYRVVPPNKTNEQEEAKTVED